MTAGAESSSRRRPPVLRRAAHWMLDQGPVWRAFEVAHALSTPLGPRADAHGVAIPGRVLRYRVSGIADATWFLSTGRQDADAFDALLGEDGTSFAEAGRVLDFGCGCGRIARHVLSRVAAPEAFLGVDYNAPLVRWCRQHLPGRYAVNALEPPMREEGASFDLLYAYSVLTHWRASTQQAWLAEFARVLRPGGRALLTFHDDRQPTLSPADAQALARDGFVVCAGLEGSNRVASFQTWDYARAMFAAHFDVAVAHASDETPLRQAVVVLRRR